MHNGKTWRITIYLCMTGGYDVYKGGDLQYEMKYSLVNVKKEMHTTCWQQLMRLLQLAITSLTYCTNCCWWHFTWQRAINLWWQWRYLKTFEKFSWVMASITLQLTQIFIVNSFVILLLLWKLQKFCCMKIWHHTVCFTFSMIN